MRLLKTGFCVTFFLLLNSCGGSNDAGGTGNPYPRTGPNGQILGETNLAQLMRRSAQGSVRQNQWAGYWWPYSAGGIASAASAYDSSHGNSGAFAWEISHHGSDLPGLQSWWGHCNGWAAAAVLFPEPRSPITVNGVSFGISDQKQLLTEIGMEVNADFFGHRNEGNLSDPTFDDVYPDQFFAVLMNTVGQGTPLIMDRFTGDQVWNQPLSGYQIAAIQPRDYLGTDPSAPNIHRVMVSTRIWWLRADVDGDHLTEPFTFSDGPSYESRVLTAELWLDAPPSFDSSGNLNSSGNIVLAHQGDYTVGGVWRNKDLDLVNSYPDYLWIPHSVSPSSGFTNPNIDPSWVINHF